MTYLTRRQLLKGAAAAALVGPYMIPSSALGAGDRPAPSNRIGAAIVGTGGQGGGHVGGLCGQPDVQVLAVCDVDRGHRERNKKVVEDRYSRETGGTYAGCAAYGDFREVMARSDVDAVLIATPEHWHALCAIAAAKAGKDIYCEKPMAGTIAEGRAAADAVRRYGRVFQTGSQERSGQARVACELVRNGRLGKLHTIRTFLPVDGYTQGTVKEEPVPDGFDYDFWLGPRPWEPYTSQRCFFNFRWILDYSDGELTDRGCHVNDIALWGAGPLLVGPVEIEGKGRFRTDPLWNVPIEFHIEYTYANGLKIICDTNGPRGIKFEGTEGWIFVAIHGGHLTAEPASVLKSVIGPNEVHLHASRGHHRDWIDAIKTRGDTVAPAEAGHRTASFCHLGLIALLTGRKVKWDLEKEEFINDSEAQRLVHRPMRSPWRLTI
jgi:predicted dehydrogenase